MARTSWAHAGQNFDTAFGRVDRGHFSCMGASMDRNELINKMRSRVDMCRRLARSTTDRQAAEALRQIADEGEADINRLLAEDS